MKTTYYSICGHYVIAVLVEMIFAIWTVLKTEKQRKAFFDKCKIFIRNPTGMYGLPYMLVDVKWSRGLHNVS